MEGYLVQKSIHSGDDRFLLLYSVNSFEPIIE